MKRLPANLVFGKSMLAFGAATALSACVVLYPSQSPCPMSADISSNSTKLCVAANFADKPATATLQLNEASTAWVLSISGPDPVAATQAALMPRTVNEALELVRPQRLEFTGDRLDVELAYPPQRGGADLIAYRLSLRLIDNAWRVTDYASAFRQRGQMRYRVNVADLRSLKMMTCDSETAFVCPADQRTTPLVKQALMPLSELPMLPEYSLKPDVKTLIR